jgi:hypothetical protein
MIGESKIENLESKTGRGFRRMYGEDAKRLSLLQISSALVALAAIEDAKIPDFNRQTLLHKG